VALVVDDRRLAKHTYLKHPLWGMFNKHTRGRTLCPCGEKFFFTNIAQKS